MTTPIDAAEAIKTNLRADTQGHAWRWMLEARDGLRLLLSKDAPDPRLVAFLARPGSTGDRGWDRFLAAVLEHELEDKGTNKPGWMIETTSGKHQSWTPEYKWSSPDRVVSETPEWLRDRGIFARAHDLETL